MKNTNAIHHYILAIGKLSAQLEIDFYRLEHAGESIITTTDWIRDADMKPGNLIGPLANRKIDYTWIFINGRDMLKPAVLHAILEFSKVSPVNIECSDDHLRQDAADILELGEYRKSISGSHKIHFYIYHSDPFRRLAKQGGIHWINPADVEVRIFCGEDARAHDPLYQKARSLVLEYQQASIGLVLRHLGIGYTHSSKLIEAMVGDILTAEKIDGQYCINVNQD